MVLGPRLWQASSRGSSAPRGARRWDGIPRDLVTALELGDPCPNALRNMVWVWGPEPGAGFGDPQGALLRWEAPCDSPWGALRLRWGFGGFSWPPPRVFGGLGTRGRGLAAFAAGEAKQHFLGHADRTCTRGAPGAGRPSYRKEAFILNFKTSKFC